MIAVSTSFPLRALVIPPVAVLALGGSIYYLAVVTPLLNMHNLPGALVGMLFWLVFAAAMLTEVVAVVIATAVLRSQPLERTAGNFVACAFGAVSFVVGIVWATSDI